MINFNKRREFNITRNNSPFTMTIMQEDRRRLGSLQLTKHEIRLRTYNGQQLMSVFHHTSIFLDYDEYIGLLKKYQVVLKRRYPIKFWIIIYSCYLTIQ